MQTRSLAVAAVAALITATAVPAGAETTVVALVASNAVEAMQDAAQTYERSHPGVKVQISGAGSKVITAQLDQGAAADFVLIATSSAEAAKQLENPVRVLANHTVMIVAKNATGKVKSPKDLANPGVRIAYGTGGSVTAQLADETIAKLAAVYGGDYAAKVKANISITKTAIEQVEKAVDDGAADAAIVWAADADTGKSNVIELGDKSYYATFSAAVVKGAKNAGAAADLVALLRSAEGQAIVKKHHHDPIK